VQDRNDRSGATEQLFRFAKKSVRSVNNTSLWLRESAYGQGHDANGKTILITEAEIPFMVAGT
jgi:hypothetical protein